MFNPTLIQRLRFVINDITSPYTYTDYQLSVYIAIAAVAVASEIELGYTFTIDTDTPDITPDPVTGVGNTIAIANLFILKAACMLSQSELRKDAARYGVKIRDHLTAYDGTAGLQGKSETSKTFCDMYIDTRWDFEKGNSSAGYAVVGPFTHYDTRDYGGKSALDWSNGGYEGRIL
jgi:hypothetical protein